MTDQWYYTRDGEKFGPFSFIQMQALAASVLSPNDMILIANTGQWASAQTVPGLFDRKAAGRPRVATADFHPTSPATSAAPARSRGGNTTLNRFLAFASVLSVPVFCLGDFMGPWFRIGIGIVWFVVGARATVTGIAPSFSGRAVRRPVAYRVLGPCLATFGSLLLWPGINRDGREVQQEIGPVETSKPVDQPARFEQLPVIVDRPFEYRSGLRPQAEKLEQALKEAGYAAGKWPGYVRLDRKGESWVVELGLTSAALDDPKTAAAMEKWLAPRIAALVCPGSVLELRLCDSDRQERAVIRVSGIRLSRINEIASIFSFGESSSEGDQLAEIVRERVKGKNVRWVILLTHRSDGWVITPLNLTPDEMSAEVRRFWSTLVREANEKVFRDKPARLEVLDDDYRRAVTINGEETQP